eukprot:1492454-Pleurochrysis_carterae.AAC.2
MTSWADEVVEEGRTKSGLAPSRAHLQTNYGIKQPTMQFSRLNLLRMLALSSLHTSLPSRPTFLHSFLPSTCHFLLFLFEREGREEGEGGTRRGRGRDEKRERESEREMRWSEEWMVWYEGEEKEEEKEMTGGREEGREKS